MDENCIFCKIVKNEIPSFKIWEDENHIAVLDIYPESTGKTVIITKQHYPSYLIKNKDETLYKLTKAMKKVGKLLDKKLDNILRVTFVIEGLEVSHLHAKLIPVYNGIFLDQAQPQREDEKKLKEIADLLTS